MPLNDTEDKETIDFRPFYLGKCSHNPAEEVQAQSDVELLIWAKQYCGNHDLAPGLSSTKTVEIASALRVKNKFPMFHRPNPKTGVTWDSGGGIMIYDNLGLPRLRPRFPFSENDIDADIDSRNVSRGEDPNQKVRKFLVLPGKPVGSYIPDYVKISTDLLVFVEGGFKIPCFEKYNIQAVSSGSVYNHFIPGTDQLKPEFVELCIPDRNILICFDSDRISNLGVASMEYKLAAAMDELGCVVRLVTYPKSDKKEDPNDRISIGGVDEIERMINESVPFDLNQRIEETKAADLVGLIDLPFKIACIKHKLNQKSQNNELNALIKQINEKLKLNPKLVAKVLKNKLDLIAADLSKTARKLAKNDGVTIFNSDNDSELGEKVYSERLGSNVVYMPGAKTYVMFDKCKWRDVSAAEVRKQACSYNGAKIISEKFEDTLEVTVKMSEAAERRVRDLAEDVSLDFSDVVPGIAFRDTFVIPDGRTVDHSKTFKNRHAFDFDYIPSASCPNFIKTLHACYIDRYGAKDTEAIIETHRRFLAACLVRKASTLRKFITLKGQPGCGKSLILSVYQEIFKDLSVECNIDRFKNQFDGGIVSKNVLLMDDQTHIWYEFEDNLKRATGGNGNNKERTETKFRDSINSPKIAGILVTMQDQPYFSDPSGALYERLIYLIHSKSFLGVDGSKDADYIKNNITPEIPNIICWALQSLPDLFADGKTNWPKISKMDSDIQNMQKSNDPLHKLMDYISYDPSRIEEKGIKCSELYEIFIKKCGAKNTPFNTFGRRFVEHICKTKKLASYGSVVNSSVRYYPGIYRNDFVGDFDDVNESIPFADVINLNAVRNLNRHLGK